MRFAVLGLLVICIFAVTIASPAKKGVKKNECARQCKTDYEPICGKAKDSTKERLLSFGNDCVMQNYNCEHPNDQFELKSPGECGGKTSVRLQ